MLLRIIFLRVCLIFLFSFSALAQEAPNKWKLTFQLDNRFSIIRSNTTTIFGAKVGVQYKNRTRVGVGCSFVLEPIYVDYFNKKLKQTETNKISFWYISIFNDWILYKNKKVECFVTEQVGYGKPSLSREVNNDVVSDINIPLYVNEISGQVNYKMNSWVGLGVGIGYRNLWNKKALLKSTFDGPIYIAKVIIDPTIFFKK